MFASDYRDDFAEESEDLYEDEPYRSDFESMLSANNSIDDQLKVSYNKDFTEGIAGQGYEDDFYNESQQGSSVVKSANIQEFSSVTFFKDESNQISPEGNKPLKKKLKRKQTPKEAKAKPAKSEGNVSAKPNTGDRRATPRTQTPKENGDNNPANRGVSNNNNNNNNNSEIDNQYHKYKRYEVHTPQMTDINTRTVIPITSHVVKDLRHNAFSIQRQLDLALKKIESYKQENSLLRSKLDSSNIEAAVERYKGALLEKEIKITQLQEENNSLKKVARHQSKGLMKSDHDRQHQPEIEMSQDRQIQILMEHIKKLKIKLEDYKVMEKQFIDENSALKTQNGKLTRRVTKLKRQVTELINGPHRSPKPDLLDMINEDLSKLDSSLVESSSKLQSMDGNETVSTYPSIALTEDSRKQMVLLPLKASNPLTKLKSSSVQLDDQEPIETEPPATRQTEEEATEEGNLRREDDDVSIPLDDTEDQLTELASQRRRSSGGMAVVNVSSITASQVNGSSIIEGGPSHQEYGKGFDASRVDSESTFSVDTNTNPRRLRKRREYNQRIQELMLQVEEEKLYVLRQKELILKLERSATKQRHGYIAEINSLKAELAKCQEDQKQVSSELSKRELKLKMQVGY